MLAELEVWPAIVITWVKAKAACSYWDLQSPGLPPGLICTTQDRETISLQDLAMLLHKWLNNIFFRWKVATELMWLHACKVFHTCVGLANAASSASLYTWPEAAVPVMPKEHRPLNFLDLWAFINFVLKWFRPLGTFILGYIIPKYYQHQYKYSRKTHICLENSGK
jgi:hypothetical protein